MMHGSTQQYITQITRQSTKVRRVTMGRGNANMPARVLITCDPHNGHKEEDRKHHWGEVKEILNKKYRRHMAIWRADANGQLGRDGAEGEKHNKNNAIRNIIGPYTREIKTEKGNDAHSPKENLPETQHDTNDNMEATQDGEKTDGEISTPGQYGRGDMGM